MNYGFYSICWILTIYDGDVLSLGIIDIQWCHKRVLMKWIGTTLVTIGSPRSYTNPFSVMYHIVDLHHEWYTYYA